MASSSRKRKLSGETDLTYNANSNAGGDENISRSLNRPEALQSVQRDDPLYSMSREKRGCAFIIKMEDYGDKKLNRSGASHDANKCKETFVSLRFEVTVLPDLGKDQLLIELENIRSRHVDNSNCLVVVFMGHGRKDEETGKEYVLLADRQEVQTSELWKPFSADNCPVMAGLPKLFFIQVCRGKLKDYGILLKKPAEWETDVVLEPEDYVIPLYSDMIMMWASYEDMPAHRNFSSKFGIYGSVFIHYLCQVLQSDSNKEDLLSMLVSVTRKVGTLYETEKGVKQLPQLSSTLMRKVIFNDRLRKLYEWMATEEKSAKLIETVSTTE